MAAALAAAQQVAKTEQDRGHTQVARELLGALSADPTFGGEPEVAASLGLLIREPVGPRLAAVQLSRETRRLLVEVLEEWTRRSALDAAGVPRRSRLLFRGPPGCGKTLTARAMGFELGLPVLTVRLSSVVGAYLGQTGANLRHVFRFAQTQPSVVLLDEFDAIGRRRGRAEDIGELDRVVVSLLQELDHGHPSGLVIAATNMEDHIDNALVRRFEVGVLFKKPTRKQLEIFALRRTRERNISVSRRTLATISSRSKSYYDIDREIDDIRRRLVLQPSLSRTRR